jgi:hypothetical protein
MYGIFESIDSVSRRIIPAPGFFMKESHMTAPKRLRAIKDRRSTWARRHRELADAFAADIGERLTAADRSVADHAATVAIACERLKAAQLNDQSVDLDDLVRLTNALSRMRKELTQKAGSAKPDPVKALHDFLRNPLEDDDDGE